MRLNPIFKASTSDATTNTSEKPDPPFIATYYPKYFTALELELIYRLNAARKENEGPWTCNRCHVKYEDSESLLWHLTETKICR